MKSRLVKIDDGINKMRGLHIKNQRALESNKKELNEALQRLKIVKQRGSREEGMLLERHISQLDESVKKRSLNYEKSKRMIDILTEVRKSAEIKVRYTEQEIKLKEEDYELMKANHKTLGVMKSLINPQTDEAFEMAMEKMDTDIATWIGEMDSFLESGITDEISLDNAVASAKADAILDKYNNGGFAGILEDNKVNMMQNSELIKLEESSNKLQNKYF